MQKRRAILHIGAPKTGTTSIQQYLALNREEMKDHGFAYPSTTGRRAHLRLALAIEAASRGVVDPLEQLKRDLGAELENLPSTVTNVIFSSEHLPAKLRNEDGTRLLREFLGAWFDDYRVVLYLRRQDEVAVSGFTTVLRSGRIRDSVLPEPSARDDFLQILLRFGAAFGCESLVPRLFARDVFHDGDLLADFCQTIGLPVMVNRPPAELNASLKPAAQEFLRRLNDIRRSKDGVHGKGPLKVRSLLDKLYAGKGLQPARRDAVAFFQWYQESNEKIRRTWFPQRAALFNEDFSRYPVECDPPPTDAEVLSVALRIMAEQEADGDQATHLVRRALEAADYGRPKEARRLLRRTLDAGPGNLDALAHLVALADDAPAQREAAKRIAAAREAGVSAARLEALAKRLGGGEEAQDVPERQTARRETRRRVQPLEKRGASGLANLTAEERRALRRQREDRRATLATSRGEGASRKRPGASSDERPG